ncbi:MAG: hypothetical protein RLN99_18675 [Kiloniellaceae bacterium]
MIRELVVFVCLGVALSACAGYKSESLGPPVYEIYKMPVKQARSYLAGKTIMTYAGQGARCGFRNEAMTAYQPCMGRLGAGTQVEYLAETGEAYLWHPDQRDIIVGVWDIPVSSNPYRVCFLYPNARKDWASGKTEDLAFCEALGAYAELVNETAEGDSFGLSTGGRVPFLLGRQEVTITDLLKRL